MNRIALLALPLLVLAASCGQKTDNASAPAGPVAAVKPPPGADWTTTVAATEDGGMRMGNPNAAVKLVEYGSLTCPHCGEFSEKGTAPLKAMVATGKLSWELRNYVRDPVDLTATLLARCGGPGPFFPMVEQMYLDQKNWFTKLQAAGGAQMTAIQALPPAQQFTRYAGISGLSDFVRQRGVSDAQANACLADKGAVDKLLAVQKRANDEFNIPGTPTFLINGQVVPDTATWEKLEPALKAAGA
ncbi:MAG: thioredoxin domain-containing protein [Sphingomonadaceae bacterium]|nr:thioredoxin domain-containing protein [Sphingomonadaceae bacterium]